MYGDWRDDDPSCRIPYSAGNCVGNYVSLAWSNNSTYLPDLRGVAPLRTKCSWCASAIGSHESICARCGGPNS